MFLDSETMKMVIYKDGTRRTRQMLSYIFDFYVQNHVLLGCSRISETPYVK